MPMQLEHDSWRYLVVWEFEVRPGCESEFEKVYGSTGDWVRLFRTANGFVRTELTRKAGSPRHYITLDFWRSEEAYEEFRHQHQQEYAAIDRRCEGLTQHEVELVRLERLGE